MKSWLVIEGIAPWDGDYEIDWSFTNQEFYDIKTISRGVRPGELLEALDAKDTAAFVGLAVVRLGRDGKRVDPDALWHAPAGCISIRIDDEGEDDAVPLSIGDTATASDAS